MDVWRANAPPRSPTTRTAIPKRIFTVRLSMRGIYPKNLAITLTSLSVDDNHFRER
jgi:hypothetical protein